MTSDAHASASFRCRQALHKVAPFHTSGDTVTHVPQETTRQSGRFWLPDTPEQTVGGWLDLSGPRPLLRLADPIMPSMRQVARSVSVDGTPYSIMEPVKELQASDGVVIHGMLRSPSRRITLVGVSNAGVARVVGGVVPDEGEQLYRAEYMLVGPQQSGADTSFAIARLRVRHLDSWANLPGIAMELAKDWSHITARSERHEEESVRVGGSAELTLDAVVTLNEPTIHGAGFRRSVELRLTEPSGRTLDEWWRRFVTPVAELLTIAVGVSCVPVELKLYREGDKEWVDVVHPLLRESSDAPLHPWQVFLTRERLTLAHIAEWLNICATLSPIPALVTEAVHEPGRPLPNQLLEMASAAEGLHRRLKPKERAIARSAKDRARRTARDAVEEDLRDRVNEALMHLDELTYAERLRYLTDLTLETVPGAVGTTTRSVWEARIKDVRNGFAHQAPQAHAEDDEDVWRERVILLRTLYWVLTAALLLQTGLKSSELRARVESFEPYRDLLRRARSWIPQIYDPAGEYPDPSG